MKTPYVSLVALAAGVIAAAVGAAVNCSGNATRSQAERIAMTSHALETHVSGAIFTTVANGSSVNANIYASKDDVYLDGGPGPNAPAKAAGLPEGDYYFQVTDPSGKELLSLDDISCRSVHVNAAGVIDKVNLATIADKKGEQVSCAHKTGTDIDHNALTVQLMPYDNTPNKGGVYKAWMTPVGSYTGNTDWQPGDVHGFVPAYSKTDNFKVKVPACERQLLSVLKFHDANANTVHDDGEEWIPGWTMYIVEPLGTDSTAYFTPVSLTASEGTWTVTEDQPAGTAETASYLDGTLRMNEGAGCSSPTLDTGATVSVDFGTTCGEKHEVIYGDIGLGSVKACKLYDTNANGQTDQGEPSVPGWQMTLSGTNVKGPYGPETKATDDSGCAVFSGLLPGQYVVAEVIPSTGGWQGTGASSYPVNVSSSLNGSTLSGTASEVAFTNICTGSADFDTKGYWHNKNGLAEMTDADIAYANGLAPYMSPSSYFDAGDEPFDGYFADLVTPVAAAPGDWGDTIADAGTAKAEVSWFLIDPNANGDPREQLAQQLLAFVFNMRHRLSDPNALIQLPNGSFASASSLVTQAIAAWSGTVAADQTAIATILDQLNNTDAVHVLMATPCSVFYP